VLEVAHVCVLDGAVDFDLAHELLFGAALGEGGLLDYFGGMDEVCLSIDEFKALGEASFAEELAFEVPANADFAALLLELLLNDRLLRTWGLTVLLASLARQKIHLHRELK